MPEANVEALIEQLLQALNARDLDRLMAPLDPEFEFYSRLLQVDGRSYKGRTGMSRFLTEVDEAFDEARWTLDEIGGRAGNNLVVVLRQRLRGRASQAALDLPSSQVWIFRNDRLWRVVVYGTRDEALEAAGLSE
jgi:hypothetical protein